MCRMNYIGRVGLGGRRINGARSLQYISPSGPSQQVTLSSFLEHSIQEKQFLWKGPTFVGHFSASNTFPLHLNMRSSPHWTGFIKISPQHLGQEPASPASPMMVV